LGQPVGPSRDTKRVPRVAHSSCALKGRPLHSRFCGHFFPLRGEGVHDAPTESPIHA
jgi:hypothetical protein